jgi:hypothetical protein
MTLPTPYCTCCGAVTCVITITGKDDVANWTQDSGTWTNSGSGGIQTTSANALAIFNTAHPDALSTGTMQFNISLPTTGAIRICMAFQDSSNYLFIEYEIMGANCTAAADCFVRMGHRTGGADTILEQINIAGQLGTPKFCYDGTIISAQNLGIGYDFEGIDGGIPGGTIYNNLDGRLSGSWGDQIAFMTIGITGTARFQLEAFYGRNDATCDTCSPACELCDDTGDPAQRSTPSEISVYIEDVVSAACATCEATFNGTTFIFANIFFSGTPDVDCETHISRVCGFNLNGMGCAAGPGTDIASLFLHFTATTNRLLLIGGDGNFSFTFADDGCSEVLSKTGGSTGGGMNVRCDWTGATIQMTPNMA